MLKSRCVLVVESPALAHCYRSALSAIGLEVSVAGDAAAAGAVLDSGTPAFVAIDPLLPTTDTPTFVAELRARPDTADLPIFILPSAHAASVEAAVAAGATLAIDREPRARRALADAARSVCGLSAGRVPPALDDRWVAGALDHALALRGALQGLARDAGDRASWHALLRHSHALAEILSLAGEVALARVATTLVWLAQDLAAMPEQWSPSIVRTLGQAIDFLTAHLMSVPRVSAPDIAGGRVLVVEDDSGAGQLVAAALQMAGLSPEVAATPASGLAAAAAGRFELILLDIGLPEMSGFDLCARLRGTPGHDRVPLVFITGMTSFQNRAQSTLSGAVDFVSKPFHPVELGLKAQLWLAHGRFPAAA